MGVKVFAPASVANLAVGYDTLGLCLEGPGDYCSAEFSDRPGVRIKSIIGDGGRLSLDIARNCAGFAAQALVDSLEDTDIGIELVLEKCMPFGTGMGSSSASAVAGAMAVNELLDKPYSKSDLLSFVAAGEQIADGAWHLDNVAPSLLGGIVLVRDNVSCDVVSLDYPDSMHVCVVHPHVELLTKDSREALSDSVPLALSVRQQANLGGLIVGLYRDDFSLIKRSFVDLIVEPQRRHLIPCFDLLQSAAFDLGALGCSISGAGPSVFACFEDDGVCALMKDRFSSILSRNGYNSTVYSGRINTKGSFVV